MKKFITNVFESELVCTREIFFSSDTKAVRMMRRYIENERDYVKKYNMIYIAVFYFLYY